MPYEYVPSPTARRLAAELKRIREDLGMSGDGVAAKLGWSPSKVSRLERARTGTSVKDVGRMLDLYRVSGPRRQILLDLATQIKDGTGDQEAAAGIFTWAPLDVPPVLQVETYTRAAAASIQPVLFTPPSAIRHEVEEAGRWQRRIGGDPPLAVQCVLGESALYCQRGTADVMRAQLEHLSTLLAHPDVDLRILPFRAVSPAGLLAFTYLRFAQPDDVTLADEVLVQDPLGAWRLSDDEQTYRYSRAFSALQDAAAAPADSADMIKHAIQDWPEE